MTLCHACVRCTIRYSLFEHTSSAMSYDDEYVLCTYRENNEDDANHRLCAANESNAHIFIQSTFIHIKYQFTTTTTIILKATAIVYIYISISDTYICRLTILIHRERENDLNLLFSISIQVFSIKLFLFIFHFEIIGNEIVVYESCMLSKYSPFNIAHMRQRALLSKLLMKFISIHVCLFVYICNSLSLVCWFNERYKIPKRHNTNNDYPPTNQSNPHWSNLNTLHFFGPAFL